MRTLYVDTSWWDYLSEHQQASSGPYPNITGMKQKYWGKDAPTVMYCQYLFLVTEDIYTRLLTEDRNYKNGRI